ncbi:GNAT family N-acetyltransferase [Pontibacter sp. E15-1]|uniref:GNAT family N-acetyltransferase n=1 Tax=Pontibacter sp. E15-1 TaxID=2919918 RepID=UPI001F4F3E4B|nr:GNAT family N-acetyltransferase [Pontibacter sp. E15-1]MCJ8163642.1 GNAT family N-acetyltransferase [Pontibacter sp. E15-1]
MNQSDFIVIIAEEQHVIHSAQICAEMESSAKARGTGIAKRSPEYITQKMMEGKAVIALHADGRWAGFCYIETWGHGKYVANSGLIVSPDLRKSGLARQIKKKIFELSRHKYPDAKIFGLTTALAVMRINSSLGYTPVTYSELTDDEEFWKGCRSCVNFEILQSKGRSNCLCTAMLYDPAKEESFVALPVVEKVEKQAQPQKANSVQDRWARHRQRPTQSQTSNMTAA